MKDFLKLFFRLNAKATSELIISGRRLPGLFR
jgi:hypothetical protein